MRYCIKKILHYKEETAQPIITPVVIEHECLLMAQQDIRKTEVSRRYSYCKVLANGVTVPMEALNHDTSTRDAIIGLGINLIEQEANSANPAGLVEHMTNMLPDNPVNQKTNDMQVDLPMKMPESHRTENEFKATLAQQLLWNKANEPSINFLARCPLLSGMKRYAGRRIARCYKSKPKPSRKDMCTRGCNTDPISHDIAVGPDAKEDKFRNII